MSEIWKPIKGYEDYYHVSNYGRVKRIEGFKYYRGKKVVCHENITLGQDNGKGYFRVKLTINNIPKSIMVHRLVAEAFLVNEYMKKCVNHIDGDKSNNKMSNLEWVTHSENRFHAMKIGLVDVEKLKQTASKNGKITIKNIQGWNSRKVKNNNTGEIFNSISMAAKRFNYNRRGFNDKLIGKTFNDTSFALI